MSDLDGRVFVKDGNVLRPADVHADEFMREIPQGKRVLLSFRKPRNPDHHRFFFAMLKRVCEATGRWDDPESLLEVLKLSVGHVSPVQRLNGETLLLPKSIAFASMDQEAFRRFVDRCVYVLADQLGIDAKRMMDEVDQEQGGVWTRLRKKTGGNDEQGRTVAPAGRGASR